MKMQTVAHVIFTLLEIWIVYWRMKRPDRSFLVVIAVVACAGLCWKPAQGQRPASAGMTGMTGGHPAAYVNPFIGASTSAGKAGIFHGLGKTFPGAATPYGMVQLSPNTITGGDNGSGYSYEHTSIEGFAFTQMSGVGWYGDLGNFLVTPTEGPLKTIPGRMDHPGEGYRSDYTKSSEKASAGYYSVMLSGSHIRAEMTATPHSGILRFTFPESKRSRIQIDLARRVGGTATREYIQVMDDHSIRGWMRCTPDGGGWGDGDGKADYTVYFYAQCSKPLRQVGAWSADIPDDWGRKREDIESDRYRERVAAAPVLRGRGGAGLEGKHLGFYTEFATGDGEQVIFKAGISFVSMEGAQQNLQTEIGGWDFDRVHAQAVALWARALSKIAVEGGTAEEKKVFYTALYHTMIDPRTMEDVDGSYPGGDGKIHRSATFTKRTIFSGWDVFRSQFPLQTIINPHVVNDMINSLVHLADESGQHYLERWEFLNAYSGCMIGNPAVSVMADAYAKGIRGFDIDKGYAYARNSCERFDNGKEGYSYGEDGISKTLEYAYSDWCLSKLAGDLGKKEDQALYAGKAGAYRNTFDDSVGWFRLRRQDGSWEPWPKEGRLQQDYGTVESNPYQQGWFVPQDVDGMVKLMGGREMVAADLESFFAHTPDKMMWNDYYNHANEPVHHVAFLFNRIGYPWLTQKWTRAICRRAYHNTVEGLVGNEDVGQMSAWYVLAATGIHPVCPGETRYEITSPVFSRIVIRLDPAYARGKTFTIIAHHNSPENIYIQGALLNGKPYLKCGLDHADIMAGGVLELTMGKKAAHWGVASTGASVTPSTGVRILAATCENMPDPTGVDLHNIHFSWQLASKDRNRRQSAWQVVCASSMSGLSAGNDDCWNSGVVRSDQSILVPYHGKTLSPGEVYYWRVRVWDDQNHSSEWSPVYHFTTGLFAKADWTHARWIGYEDLPDSLRVVPGFDYPHADNLGDKCRTRPVIPLFRKAFHLYKTVSSALVFVCGLGQYEMTINGVKAGNALLTPGWTDYDKHCLYDTYDVTALLQKGENVVGAIVGNGFYNINRQRYFKLVDAFGCPKLLCRVKIRFTDGTVEDIVSDQTWRTSRSPISFTSIYGGEDYDARLENRAHWKTPLLVKPPRGQLVAAEDYPVKVQDSFTVQHVSQPAPGKYVYDFGQNAAGIVELKVQGKRGQTVKLTPAEILDSNHMADQAALSEGMDSLYYLSYTIKGEGVETWRPRFTYYGFRYIQMEGADPAQVSLKALHIRNSAPSSGSFDCSDSLFRRIFTLIDWAIKSNLESIVTDCPHREKLGWLEQDYLMGASIHYNFDIYHLYSKIVKDMMDAQTEDGLVPDIAPEFVTFGGGFRDSPEWGSASVILPWLIYSWYGDKQLMQTAYPMMQRYVRYLQSQSSHGILSYGLGDWYDYGPGPPGDAQLTPKALTASAIFYYDVTLMAKMATLLQYTTDAAGYQALATQLKTQFNETFFHLPAKVYATGSQTAMAMPLCVGLVEDSDKIGVLANLVDSINMGGRALTAGDIGFHFLVKALDEGGNDSLIYEMNDRSDGAGYGLQLKKGATALTESWNALEHSSNDHLMLGHIMEWFYSGLAGISQDEHSVAYKRILIRPRPVGAITSAKGSFLSPYGMITTDWQVTDAGFSLAVHLPVNTTATISLPLTAAHSKVYLDNKQVDSKDCRVAGNTAFLEVGSGDYRFEVRPVDKMNR